MKSSTSSTSNMVSSLKHPIRQKGGLRLLKPKIQLRVFITFNIQILMRTIQAGPLQSAAVSERIDLELRCPICLERYGGPLKAPRALPCLHSLCSACLTIFIKNGTLLYVWKIVDRFSLRIFKKRCLQL